MALAIKKVLVSDPVDPSCLALLTQHGIQVTTKYKLPKEELIAIIPEYDGLVVRSETKVTAEVLEAGGKLKVVGRAGTGVDNIDCKAATQKGVIVLNTPGGNSISACELTCSLITALARNIAAGCQSLKEGRWDRKLYTGSELSGKTLAVLGLGRIGREVALRMQAYGMRTIGFDPMVSKEQANDFKVDKMELEEIWPQADYITVHTPLIPQTRNLINTETLKKCKKGVKIINVARGGIVDEMALLQSLKEGHCGGAALDVFTEEPPKSEGLMELIKHPKVVATPHLGASTEEAQVRVAVEIAEQFVALAFPDSGYPLTGIVNAPALLALRDPANQPWINLSKGLGGLAGKLAAGEPFPSLKVRIETEGEELRGKGFLVTPALMGMMKGRRKNGLNLINTPSLASEAGLQGDIVHLGGEEKALSVGLASSSFKHRLRGVARGSDALLMSIDDAHFANGVPLDANTLLFCSQNPQTDTSAIIAELVKKGAVIRNLAIASGKCAWISIQADNLPEVPQIPNVRAFM